MICQKCNNEFLNQRSLGNHQKVCLHNQDNNLLKLKNTNKKRCDFLHSEYDKNPTKCKQCLTIIPFRRRKYTFCCRSCSATYNNTHKDKKEKIKTACIYCGEIFKPIKNSKGKFCGVKCVAEYKKYKTLERDKLAFDSGALKSRNRIKIFIKNRDGEKCSKCNNSEWMGCKITLWLDHIDGNASNNTPENFRLICPNCDSLNNTFGGKNRGKGRKSRGLKSWE